MSGKISLSFESDLPHNPPEDLKQVFHQTLIARDVQDTIQGVSTRSGSELYVNGEPQMIGYFGLLRLTREYHSGIPLKRGVNYMKELHTDGRVPYYLTSIMEDNHVARRMLTANKRGFFKYEEYCRLVTHTLRSGIHVNNQKLPGTLRFQQAGTEDIPDILDCLSNKGRSQQFSPVWTQENLFHPSWTPGLAPSDFILIKDGPDTVGCGAVWDQRIYRRILVLDYAPPLKQLRLALNLVSRILDKPHLPPAGAEISHAFLSLLVIPDDDPQIFEALLQEALTLAKSRSIDNLMIGLNADSPFEQHIAETGRSISSPSIIYLVSDPAENISPLELIDPRTPGLEVALL